MGETSTGILHRVRGILPHGMLLPSAVWQRRHRMVLVLIFAHAPALAAFGLYQGWGYAYSLGEGALIAVLGALAAWKAPGTRFRATMAAFAGVTSSAVLVQFSGGYIEAHFHFFIIVALIALYQDWLPFLFAVAYVAVDHGILGQVAPHWVYNHEDAVLHPWKWATVHAVMVLGQCAVLLALWHGTERERARSDVILESVGEGILGLNDDGTTQFANPAAARILGTRQQDMLGKPFPRLAHLPDGWPPASLTHQTTLARADGASVPLLWVVRRAPETDSGVAWVASVHDLTEAKRAERVRLDQLMEQDRFKTQLLNTASHELNTPISVLRLQLDLLKLQLGEAPPAATGSLDLLDRNVSRLASLVQQTLDVARIQSGKLRIDPRLVAVDGLLKDTCRSFGQAAALKGIDLGWDIEAGLELNADPTRLSQVFYNLVANAVKFTPEGGRVKVTAHRGDGHVRIAVQDTGPGITVTDHAKLFQPFSQGANAQGGTGLGLYISRSIVEGHGGRLEVHSSGPGQGSTFTCTLPHLTQLAPRVPVPA